MEVEDFRQVALKDPWTNVILRMWADAWVQGFEEARRDVSNGADGDDLYRLDYGTLRRRADEHLTKRSERAERELIASLATLGPLLPDDLLRGFTT